MSDDSTYYPILLNLSGRTAVVVGGGDVAQRKVEGLLAAGAHVRVVAPEISEAIAAMTGAECRREPYSAAVLDGATLAIAATDCPEVNAQVAADCRRAGILCNVVDVPDECDFILPAVLRRGLLVVAVSTSGAAPRVAGRIRRQLETEFGPAYAAWLLALGEVRARLKTEAVDASRRRTAMLRLAEDDVLAAAEESDDALRQKIADILSSMGLKEAAP
jgi:precorrin-2 dehydrogenase